MNKNTNPATLNTTNIGDAVVVRLNCGTQQSAIVRHVDSDGSYAAFDWPSGNGQTAGIGMGRSFFAERVLAIFPPGVKFLAV